MLSSNSAAPSMTGHPTRGSTNRRIQSWKAPWVRSSRAAFASLLWETALTKGGFGSLSRLVRCLSGHGRTPHDRMAAPFQGQSRTNRRHGCSSQSGWGKSCEGARSPWQLLVSLTVEGLAPGLRKTRSVTSRKRNGSRQRNGSLGAALLQ